MFNIEITFNREIRNTKASYTATTILSDGPTDTEVDELVSEFTRIVNGVLDSYYERTSDTKRGGPGWRIKEKK